MKGISAILFDWDGTLIDSYPSGYRASMAVFHHYGIEVDRELFLSTYNPNWYETYRRFGLPPEEWDTADRIWRDSYHQVPPDLYPFARQTLATLQRHEYSLGLVTSGNRERVTRELNRHQLDNFFSVRIYFEDTKEKKPHPAPLVAALEQMDQSATESAYVGDRPEDILMGRQTGCYTVGVESAYVTLDILEQASPDIILPNVGQLAARFGPRRE